MKHSVQIQYDLDCQWEGAPPRYRLYVNDELFTERTWIWRDQYLEEVIPIDAPAGEYHIKYELIGQGSLFFGNGKIVSGPAEFVSKDCVRINHAST